MNNPKVEFNIGQAVELTLLSDNVITGVSQYGHWNMYPVLHENKIHSFFAPQEVVDFINKKGLGKNSVINVTKEIKRNGRKFVTDFSIDVLSKSKAIVKNDSVKPNKKRAGTKAKSEFTQLREAIINAVNDLFHQRQAA